MSSNDSAFPLCSARCVPCEGGVPKLTLVEASLHLKNLPEWKLMTGPDRISRSWIMRNFAAGMQFFSRIAELAEQEGHHPDLHLVGYRDLTVEIWTHAVGGLSLNDFILAAKIDQLPIVVRSA